MCCGEPEVLALVLYVGKLAVDSRAEVLDTIVNFGPRFNWGGGG